MAGFLISLVSFADPIPLTLGGGPPSEYGGNGNRGIVLLPTIDYTNGEVTVFVPYTAYGATGNISVYLNSGQSGALTVTCRVFNGSTFVGSATKTVYVSY